jgi:hypothetical protein
MHVNVKFKFALNACMDAPQEEWSAYGYYNNKLLIIISPSSYIIIMHASF